MNPKQQLQRAGIVSFGDASLAILEDSIPSPSSADGLKQRDAWELAFKRQVFARIVQTLNKLGWTCAIPESYVKQYNMSFARDRRECQKGDLKGWLEICGRSISFEMWQGVNTPTRPDHGGKYESDKEGCMPYVLRLEMERTRRRIRDYLCNVFSGYSFDVKRRSIYRKPLQFTAFEIIQESYAKSWHFKGVDWESCKAAPGMRLNLKSADGQTLEHGQRVWTTDWHGRWVEGTALYNINNMWWVVLGKYDYTNKACFDLHASPPQNVRCKQNQRQRRKRLESEMSKAVKAMDFDRAKVLKNILWPVPEPLFYITKNGAYFQSGYCGYTTNQSDAGKFTKAELLSYGDQIKQGTLQAVSVQNTASCTHDEVPT